MKGTKEKSSGAKKKLKKLQSTQMWSPIKDIKDGIVLTKDQRYVQILEFAPINFHLLQEDEKVLIANTFGAAIRAFPKRFQFKILSRQASPDTHIKDLQACMEKETIPQCRAMQLSNIMQIQDESRFGTTRRFFVSFEYDGGGRMRRPVWKDVLADLQSKSQAIAYSLVGEPCNNALLNRLGNSEDIMDILYNFMCRAEAEVKPVGQRVMDVVAAHIQRNGYDPAGNVNIPINDFLAPRRVNTSNPGYIEVDGKYYTFGYIAQNTYQQECFAGWLSALINISEGVDVDIFCEKKSTALAKEGIARSRQLNASERSNRGVGATDNEELEEKERSSDYLQKGLTHGHDIMDFSILLTVVADDPVSLQEKFKYVQDCVLRLGPQLNPTYFNHDLAFLAALPLCDPKKEVLRYARRNILSGDFGAFYPFTSFEINDPHGVKIGMNYVNNSPVFLDLFNRELYNNGNGVMFGTSGSGKTYFLQCLALRYRQLGTKVVIIAPYKGHEFQRACEEIGGSFIKQAPGSPYVINPMEIRRKTYRNGMILVSILADKIQRMHTFFSLIMPDMSHLEKTLLDEALLHVYGKFGITMDNSSLDDPLNPGYYKQMPILGDLYDELNNMGERTQSLRESLYRFVFGSASSSFNGQTNVNLDNNYVVLDISGMPDELMPIAIFVDTDFVNDYIRSDVFDRKALFVDEASRMIGLNGCSAAAKFLLDVYKTIRAFNAIVISASQDTNDFMALENGLYGEGILANARMKIVMRPEEREVERLTEKLNLSKAESRQLPRLERGDALLIVNRNHTKIHVTASFEEHRLITTDPDELNALFGAAV